MLKHKDIIEKLTKEQKIALVTDTRDGYGSALEQYNIPTTAINELWEENSREGAEPLFPSANSLANSWDEELLGDVARCLATKGAEYGDNLFILPSSSAASSVYGSQLSEDPHLSGSLVAGMAKGLKDAKAPYCLKEPVCSMDDARFLDKEASLSVLYDRYVHPYKMVSGVGGAYAMIRSGEETEGSYKAANERLYSEFVPDALEKIVQIKDADTTASVLVSGNQIMGGSSLVISTALDNYERIYRSMEEGGATAQELNMTLIDGAAISEEIIDRALDKKLQLASKCSGAFGKVAESEIKECAYKAARKSVVLVKNLKSTLPLRNGERICVCGDIISDGEGYSFKSFFGKLSEHLSGIVGFERGYDLMQSVSEELMQSACDMASGADVTLAFVGLGTSRERELEQNPHLALPGNQIAMLTHLKKVSKKLVVVICGERLPDMSFDVMADAILLAPSKGAYVAEALGKILSGRSFPSGKLAYAGYSNVDTVVREIQKRKSMGKQKIGPFVGYRYTDSNGEWTKYPMGFGLSYTSFEYSKLMVDVQGTVTLTVRNTGRMEGSEAVQVYVSVPGSARIRPRKELKGFLQVRLRPGERRTVSISLGGLELYDEIRQKTIVEAGSYDVHIGSSANNILMSRRVGLIGATLDKEDKRLSDYLQNVSNIVSESYTMEAYCKPMNTKSKLKGFGIILLLATIFADAAYVISGFMNPKIPMLDSIYLTVCLIINGSCLALSLIFIIAGHLASGRAKRILRKQEREATKELFKTVKPADVSAIDQLFADEFDMALDASNKKEVVLDEKDASTYTYMAVDTDIPTLCSDLSAHLEEYGIVVTPKMARRILSSLMTSRLLIVRNAIGVSCEKLVDVFAHFFGSVPHVEKVGGVKWERKSLLRYNDQGSLDKNATAAPLFQAINTALSDGDKANFYGIAGVRFEDLGTMLMPYVQYFGNPDIEHKIVDDNETVTMPSNLWFVVTASANQSIEDLPAFIANLATVIDLEGQAVPEASTKSTVKPITCHQMDALIFRAKKAADIDENVWKGVDSLEEFVREKTPFNIGNKLFLQIERYLSVYTACEEDVNEAMDCAVAGKLIPGILNLLKGNEGMADTDLAQVVESIFGEEYSIASCNVIKNPVLYKEAASYTPMAAETPQQDTVANPFNAPVAEEADVSEAADVMVETVTAEPVAQANEEPQVEVVATPQYTSAAVEAPAKEEEVPVAEPVEKADPFPFIKKEEPVEKADPFPFIKKEEPAEKADPFPFIKKEEPAEKADPFPFIKKEEPAEKADPFPFIKKEESTEKADPFPFIKKEEPVEKADPFPFIKREEPAEKTTANSYSFLNKEETAPTEGNNSLFSDFMNDLYDDEAQGDDK